MSNLCSCGCGLRKPNPRRRFYPGHNAVNANQNSSRGQPDNKITSRMVIKGLKAKCRADVYHAHPTLLPCDGNDGLIISMIETFWGVDVVPTLSLFEDILADDPSKIKRLVHRSVAR